MIRVQLARTGIVIRTVDSWDEVFAMDAPIATVSALADGIVRVRTTAEHLRAVNNYTLSRIAAICTDAGVSC